MTKDRERELLAREFAKAILSGLAVGNSTNELKVKRSIVVDLSRQYAESFIPRDITTVEIKVTKP